MSNFSLLLPKIVHYTNTGLLQDYYKSNVTFAMAVEAALIQIETIVQKTPFENELLATQIDGTNNSVFVNNSSIQDFNTKMLLITKNFIEACVEVLHLFRKNKRLDENKTEILNNVHLNFLEKQNIFYKNFSNYISIYLFFQDMSTLPDMFDLSAEDSDKDLINGFLFSDYVLSNKDHLLETNLRNMTRANFRQYQCIFKAIKKCFRVACLNNEETMTRQMVGMNHGIPSTLLKYVDRFLKFPTLFQSALVEYLDALDYYYIHVFHSCNRNSTQEALLYHDQHDLENALYRVIALIGASDYISSVEIVEGGRDHVLNEILEIEGGSGQKLGKARVIQLIEGHIRSLTVQDLDNGGASNSAIDYTVGEKLIAMEGENNTFDIEVSEIKDGYITSVSEQQTIIAGFNKNDSISTNLVSTDTTGQGSDVNFQVTAVSGQLRSIALNGSGNETFQHGDKFELSPQTSYNDSTNAEITIRTITPRGTEDIFANHSIVLHSNSYDSATRNTNHTPHTFDLSDYENTKKASLKRGLTEFDLNIDEMLFDPERFDLSENITNGSSIDDPVVLNDGTTNGLTTLVKEIEITPTDLYNYIEPDDGAQAKIRQEFSETVSIDGQAVDKVTVTEIELAAGVLDNTLTSSTSTYDYKAIGTQLTNFQYGGVDADTYTATVTGITYAENELVNSVTINTNLQSSEPTFSQSLATSESGFTYTGLSIEPSIDSITVPENSITQGNEIKIKDGVTISNQTLTNGRNEIGHHGTTDGYYTTETYNATNLNIDITTIVNVPASQITDNFPVAPGTSITFSKFDNDTSTYAGYPVNFQIDRLEVPSNDVTNLLLIRNEAQLSTSQLGTGTLADSNFGNEYTIQYNVESIEVLSSEITDNIVHDSTKFGSTNSLGDTFSLTYANKDITGTVNSIEVAASEITQNIVHDSTQLGDLNTIGTQYSLTYDTNNDITGTVQSIEVDSNQILSNILHDSIQLGDSNTLDATFSLTYNNNNITATVKSIDVASSQIFDNIRHDSSQLGSTNAIGSQYSLTYDTNNDIVATVKSIEVDPSNIINNINYDNTTEIQFEQTLSYDDNSNVIRAATSLMDVDDVLDNIAFSGDFTPVVDTEYTTTFNYDGTNSIQVSLTKDSNDVVSKSFLYDFNTFFSTINSSIDNLQTTNSWSDTIADSFKVWVQQSSLYTDNSASGITLSSGSTVTYATINWADISSLTGTLATDFIENVFAVESPYFIATIILLQEMESLAENVADNSDATDASTAIAGELTIQNAPTEYTGPEILESTIRISDGFTGFAENTNFTVTENYSPTGIPRSAIGYTYTGTPSKIRVTDFNTGLSGNAAFSMDGAYVAEGDVTSYVDLNSAIEYTSTSDTFTLASPDVGGLAGNAGFTMVSEYSPTGSVTDTNTAMEYTSVDLTITLQTGYSGLAGNTAFSMDGGYTPQGSVTDVNTAIVYTMNNFRLQSGHTELGGSENNNFSINYTPQGSITSYADLNTAILYTVVDNSPTIQLATGHTSLAGDDLSEGNFTFTHIPVGSPTITKSVVDSNNETVNTMIIESDHVFSNLNTDYNLYTVPTQTDYSGLSGFPTLTITLRDPTDDATIVSEITLSSDQAVTPLPDIEDTNVFTSVPTIESLRGNVTDFVVTHAEFIEPKDNYELPSKVALELTLPNNHKIAASIQDNIQGLYEPNLTQDYLDANPGATVESLGITDYISGDSRIQFVNPNGFIIKKAYNSQDDYYWRLRHPDNTTILQINLSSNLLTSTSWRYFSSDNNYHTASNNERVSDTSSILEEVNQSKFEMILSGDKSQVKGHLNTFSFTHDAFTSVFTPNDEPFASTNDYFVVLDSNHPRGALEVSGNPNQLTGIKNSTINFDDGVYTDPEGNQQTISAFANNIKFKNTDTNDNVNGIGTEPDGTIVDFSISFGNGVTSLTVDSIVLADSASKFIQNNDNNPLQGIAKSIKLGATDGITDYIILPINPFSGNVDSQSQSFLYDTTTTTHFVYLHSSTSTPLSDTSKIKITPVGLISKFKDIYDENTGLVISDNISMTSLGKIRYEQDYLEFQNDSETIKRLYTSQHIHFSGTLDYTNAGVTGEPIGDYDITNRGSGFDGVTSPLLSQTFARISDPLIPTVYNNDLNRNNEGLGAVEVDSTEMFLGEIREYNLIDGGQNYTTDSVIEFKKSVESGENGPGFKISLPEGHLINEDTAAALQGVYLAQPVDGSQTLQDLGITDQTIVNSNLQYVGPNGFYIALNNGIWYLRNPNNNDLAVLKFFIQEGNSFVNDADVLVRYTGHESSANNNDTVGSNISKLYKLESLTINTGGVITTIDGKYTVTSNPNNIELKDITSPEESGDLKLIHEDGTRQLEKISNSKWGIKDIATGILIVTSDDFFNVWKAEDHSYSNPFHDLLKWSNLNNIVILEPATYSFKVNTVNNGIITGISISNGGKDFVADAVLQVQDEDRLKTPTTVKITDLDNNHIEQVELVDPGSGYVNGDNTVKNIKDAVNNETVRIQTDNDYGNTNESILYILQKLDSTLKGN